MRVMCTSHGLLGASRRAFEYLAHQHLSDVSCLLYLKALRYEMTAFLSGKLEWIILNMCLLSCREGMISDNIF